MAKNHWPFHRYAPDCVVLGVREGTEPSAKPPVRIFLGTEEAQYRAERIFFYSIEKVRDPSRVYEIHLMNNLEGFDRRKWRTGFTNYRYAIPTLAGDTGRAIYNDVDQIYLADPALLFDLEMGDHGYLAISAKDTSVMLIDCDIMRSHWNRDNSSTLGKHALINKPASISGLWGELDSHWNARDQEYVEGLTKCLHYTALHQQPWHPFPDDYSYHPNPLAYIWYDLEREADAQGYELFSAEFPSPNFEAVLGRNEPDDILPAELDSDVAELLERASVETALLVQAAGTNPDWNNIEDRPGSMSFALKTGEQWPNTQTDAVLAAGLFEHIPPADIPWVMNALFSRARTLVQIRLPATEPMGLGSVDWWRKRVEETAKNYPGVSWQLDITDLAAAIPGSAISIQRERSALANPPLVWLLNDGDPWGDAQIGRLANALGWNSEIRHLAYNAWSSLPKLRSGATIRHVSAPTSRKLSAPWPDLVISAGKRSALVSGWIRKMSSGRTRAVQLGHPNASFDLFDLIVASPDQRVPVRDNVLHLSAELVGVDQAGLEVSVDYWRNRLGDVQKPTTLLVAGPGRNGYRFTVEKAATLGALADKDVLDAGGRFLVAIAPNLPKPVETALLSAISCPYEVINPDDEPEHGLNGLVAAVDRCILPNDDGRLLTVACQLGKQILMAELPRWHDSIPGAGWIIHAFSLLAGGGTSYRGTPHQQHLLARGMDHMMTRGWITMSPDLTRLHRALAARGLLVKLDDQRVIAARKPLNDLEITVGRIQQLMSEAP